MTQLLSIDPGSEKSAVLRYCVETHTVDCAGILPNMEVLDWLDAQHAECADMLVIEITKPYTLQTKKGHSYYPTQLQDTAIWIGRFIQKWDGPYAKMDRRRVKQLLCGITTVGDAQIRDAILDRYGGTREKAIGKKASPGPLYGIKRDLFAALAVAIAYCEEMAVPHGLDCTKGEEKGDG